MGQTGDGIFGAASAAAMTAFSAFAYALAVMLGVACCRRFAPGPFAPARPLSPARAKGACLCVLAAFFFMPPGSLPPFCNAPQGGAVFLCLLGFSFVLSEKRGAVTPFCVLLFAVSAFSRHALQRGIPGGIANLGTFVAMPVWSFAFPADLFGFALLASGTAFAAVRLASLSDSGGSLAASAQHLAVCALWVALFFPLNCAPFVQWPDMAAAGCDFLLFWMKTMFFCRLVRSFGRFRHAGRVAFICNGAGAAIVFRSFRLEDFFAFRGFV